MKTAATKQKPDHAEAAHATAKPPIEQTRVESLVGNFAMQRAVQAGREERGERVPNVVRDALRTGGQPLDASSRALMESQLGHDFGDVRVHTGSAAARSAAAVGAQAYTVGTEIAFGAGRFAPTTADGHSLLAHELTHVVQQRGSEP
ncbi:MAG TPA: DUF4157 domain-containing protein, partial [Thermoanaerobaculia bacterium]